MLPLHARCVLSRLGCNGYSLLLSSYLSRIGRIDNPSCSACPHSSQDTSHLILHCPATDSLRRSLFGDSLCLYDLWLDPGELLGFWSCMVFRHAPIPRKGSGSNNSVLLNVILFGTFDMKISVTFFTLHHCFYTAMCTASLLLLRNNPVLETVKAYVLQSFLRSTPHALFMCNSPLGQVRPCDIPAKLQHIHWGFLTVRTYFVQLPSIVHSYV